MRKILERENCETLHILRTPYILFLDHNSRLNCDLTFFQKYGEKKIISFYLFHNIVRKLL